MDPTPSQTPPAKTRVSTNPAVQDALNEARSYAVSGPLLTPPFTAPPPVVVNHYYAPVQPRSRATEALKWVMIGGVVAGVLLAVALVAVAVAVAAGAVTLLGLLAWKVYKTESAG